ncbi:hypothetical protein [Desulfurococcus mucosus]|uniref:Uncharacterized protein n=1 Tax=Desulfurococcus mucosus (strain ATCC 35584 / DSM 2162 / JCM 9187 / O7/1) TaxID=765177 RepID=E8R784_DESM0|nr:hypothetical protein [Desulfurococcus mucosus]ADV65549.1 hypothetical protein Desmu_1253 [Desulfurococcus mucosus DSM 2162]
MWTLVLRIESKGCASCVATALTHLFKIKGVSGVKVRGREILVLLRDRSLAEEVVNNPVLREYYVVKEWRIVDGNLLSEAHVFKL